MDDREAGRYGRPDHVARPSRLAQPETKDDEIARLRKELKEKDEEIARLRKELKEKDEEIARLRKELKEKDEEIARLKKQVAELKGQQGNPNFLDLGKAGGPLLPFDPLNP